MFLRYEIKHSVTYCNVLNEAKYLVTQRDVNEEAFATWSFCVILHEICNLIPLIITF